MLKITRRDGKEFHYVVQDALTAEELRTYYRAIDDQYRAYGRLHLHVTARRFSGYADGWALFAFLRGEPTLLRRVATYQIESDQAWLRVVIGALGRVVPGIRVTVRPAVP